MGELGWELYIPTEFATGVFDAIVGAGAQFGLRHAGYHALDSLRMEKGYRHWGHDITPDVTPLEAGLGFAVAWDKPGGFIGRDALLRPEARPGVRNAASSSSPSTDYDKLLYHNEPIWRDGVIVGSITSGAFGHTIDASLGNGLGVGAGGCHGRSRLGAQWHLRDRGGRRACACTSVARRRGTTRRARGCARDAARRGDEVDHGDQSTEHRS